MPGLRHTRVMHPRFEQHHRPVSADAMPATCIIEHPAAESGWDDTAGKSVYGPRTLVYGPDICRVSAGVGAISTTTQTVVADRAVTLAQYTVVIPTCTPVVRVNDLVTVTCCNGDPDLVGRTMRVTNAVRGTTTWERVLSCELQPPTTR